MKDNMEFSILIADGDVSVHSTLREILEDRYKLLFTEKGKNTVKMARDKQVDAILLAESLPDMNGFDVLTELKTNEETHNIPVILIIGEKNDDHEEKAFFLGCADYVRIPFRPSVVKARVRTQLEIVRQARRVERYALIDMLVDLPNRRSFDTQMETEWGRAIREKTPVNLLMVDVDDFKAYNDEYGHEQGDMLLRTIAKVLMTTLKRKTDMVFRWGGDMFAVILQDTTLGGALRVAEDIRVNVESAKVQGTPSRTVSIGIASASPGTESNISELINAADNALKGAKEGGKNTARAYSVI